VGKTTLVRMLQPLYKKPAVYIDLESDEDSARLENAEMYFLQRQDQLIIIDEVQRRPELFALLRSVIDKKRDAGRFLLLGSASPELMLQSAESLAGRVAYLEVHPFCYTEVSHAVSVDTLWLRGGFPQALLAASDALSLEMRTSFIKTYLEREMALLGLSTTPTRLGKLLRMLAHLQAQTLNATQVSNSLGIDVKTLARYLDFFEYAFLIRRLPAYHTNAGKRLVKSPKVFIRDTGILHALAGIETRDELDVYPAKGSSWESFVVQQILARLHQRAEAAYYRTQDGTELDLVISKGLQPVAGIEIKLTNAPTITKGTTLASRDLGNIPVYVVTHSAAEDYAHNDLVTVTSFERIFFHLDQMKLLQD
jgi:predicted AAA+ superfamily ATPase